MNRFEAVKDELRRKPRAWLVTGVAGFIGSNLLETLLSLNQTVIGLDNFSSGHRRNINEVLRDYGRLGRGFRLIEGDIRNLGTCLEVTAGVDYVLHQAALGSVPHSLLDPVVANQINVDGTVNILLAARDRGVRRVVFASSSAVYGDCAALPHTEERLGAPLSPYAVSKFTDEKYAEVFSRAYGLSTVGLRYFNVFGPRQDPLGSYAAVIPQWIQGLLSGEPSRIHGDGETTRDFVAIGDVVQANILAATAELGQGSHRVYNVGAGRRTSLNELHAMLRDALSLLHPRQPARSPIHDQPREGDIRHSQAEVTRIVSELGYAPTSNLGGALMATMQWYLKRLNSRPVLAISA